jgi:hypothetical protein
MGTLMFECPATGMEVSTGIEVDTASFDSLYPLTAYLACPHCPRPHPMHSVRTWLSKGIENTYASVALGDDVQSAA